MTEAVQRVPSELDEAVDRYLAHLRVERGLLTATLEAYARDLREYVEWLTARRVPRLADVNEPLILQHGWPQSWWAWRKMIPALAEHYRVICPDLRGQGWSTGHQRNGN